MTKKICLLTLGCPKNVVEGETLAGLLANSGWGLTTDLNKASAAIVHTCSFIKDARNESAGVIKALSDLRRNNKLEKLIVSGCMVQGDGKALLNEFKYVDGFIGTGGLQNITKLLSGEKDFILGSPGGLVESPFPRLLSSELATAYIRIAEGCSHRCSFCSIPSLRGRYKSRSIKSVVSEAEELSNNGIKELILIAQDTTYYGYDKHKKFLLSKLLKELVKIDKLEWIRIMYAYPNSINNELIETINLEEKICKYLDVPLQHVSNRVLSAMHRQRNVKRFIKKIKKMIPGLAIRTTFITGFPGETKKDFDELYDFVSEGHFEQLGVFEYSDNENTASCKYGSKVDDKISKDRRNCLMLLQKNIVKKNNISWKNKSLKVLVEGESKDKKHMHGRAYFQAPEIDNKVIFKGNAVVGDFADIKITGSKGYDLTGINKEVK
jgi:ribosomal protein S12 methylthiotransferase